MNTMLKRSLALLTALVLCLGMASGLTVQTDAAEYVANWGTRGEVATSLSDYALAFYTGSYTFDNLADHQGTHLQNQVPESDLYLTLQAFMISRHTHQTTYGETRYQYAYTDCEKGDTSTILSFYSGKPFSSKWDQGATWNREHTWPASKSLSGRPSNGDDGEGADIMMLRPTLKSENGSRGNDAFGLSSGFQDPGEDVRGDVSRIVLYTYVRWGNSKYMWGRSGVIESLDLLLAWMQEDPVDTWEMGRNDAVQSITGTRNVFVDYPELAFLLFDRQIPTDMVTPSGEAANSGNTQIPPVTEPQPTVPAPTEPLPTEPVPTKPAPTEPLPTEPVPTEPTPTDPAPTEPSVTEPPASQAPGCAHKTEKIPALAPTQEASGHIEHYKCTLCGKRFADAAATQRLMEDQYKLDKLPAAAAPKGPDVGLIAGLATAGVVVLAVIWFLLMKKK